MTDPRAWLARVRHAADTLPHGQRPTEMHIRIAAKLAFWRSRTPTHRAIARAARCSRGTVLNALSRLRTLGLLSWSARVVCGRGWAVRVANAYDFRAAVGQITIRIHSNINIVQPRSGPATAIDQRAAEGRVMRDWMARKGARSGVPLR